MFPRMFEKVPSEEIALLLRVAAQLCGIRGHWSISGRRKTLKKSPKSLSNLVSNLSKARRDDEVERARVRPKCHPESQSNAMGPEKKSER